MTNSPVGMRCPTCASDRPDVRSADARPSGGAVLATYVLLGMNVLAFLGELSAGGGALSADGGGRAIVDGGLYGPAIDQGEWWRIVTSGFLHAGPLHLLLNMFALYVLGTLLEPAIGTARFAALYAVSLLAGSFGALLADPAVHTVGASGAIFGLMAATFVLARGRGVGEVSSQIGVWILINLAFTFGVPGISIGGHLGGLVGGGLAGLALAASERRPGWSGSAGAMALALAVIAAVSVAGALWAAGRPV
jgi:membrane associated rhomboid family serine protease